jgi:hypothetical protein
MDNIIYTINTISSESDWSTTSDSSSSESEDYFYYWYPLYGFTFGNSGGINTNQYSCSKPKPKPVPPPGPGPRTINLKELIDLYNNSMNKMTNKIIQAEQLLNGLRYDVTANRTPEEMEVLRELSPEDVAALSIDINIPDRSAFEPLIPESYEYPFTTETFQFIRQLKNNFERTAKIYDDIISTSNPFLQGFDENYNRLRMFEQEI